MSEQVSVFAEAARHHAVLKNGRPRLNTLLIARGWMHSGRSMDARAWMHSGRISSKPEPVTERGRAFLWHMHRERHLGVVHEARAKALDLLIGSHSTEGNLCKCLIVEGPARQQAYPASLHYMFKWHCIVL